jgi:cytoskeletal protein CcmA (bactofilin family)
MVTNRRPHLGGGCSRRRKFVMGKDFRRARETLRWRNDLQSVHSRRIEREEDGGQSMDAPQTGEFAHIGKSVVIKGELSGSEDLYVDGNVEGKIELRNHSLTVGPNGNVKADVSAKAVVIQGKLDGTVIASERVELRKSAVVTGDVTTQRIAIEEGAFLKGKVDIQKEAGKAGAATS